MTRFSYAIVSVKDMQRSVKFYRDALGLPLRFQSPEWAEFATGSCNLALHVAAEGVLAPIDTDRLPAGHCHVGLSVTDLDEFHHRMTGLGVHCLRQPKNEQFGRMAVYADPDGLPVSVMQSAVLSAPA